MPQALGGMICGPVVDGDLVPSPLCFEDIADWVGSEDHNLTRSGRATLTRVAISFYVSWKS